MTAKKGTRQRRVAYQTLVDVLRWDYQRTPHSRACVCRLCAVIEDIAPDLWRSRP